jgi:ribosomal protein L9
MNSLRQASLQSLRSLRNTSIQNSTTIAFKQQIRNGHSVRIILTSDLPDGKGYAGEVLSVKSGYARNHLIPLQKALYATPTNFERVGMSDPDLIVETSEEKKMRESMESDEDLKAADFLRHYLRNKTLEIWRMVDVNSPIGSGLGAPIHPGMVDHVNVRDKLGRQLGIDLQDHELVQIYPEPISHALIEEEDVMEDTMQKMEVLKDGEDCKVQIKALGEYAVKIHLKGGQEVGLKLAVRKR